MNASPEFQFFLSSEGEMMDFGARLSSLLKAGDVIALYGDLGAGKTTLSRGLIHALLGNEDDVPSPTYTIVQSYDAAPAMVWHFDLYRLEDPEEVIEIGFEEALDDICLIEWPEKAGRYLPADRLSLNIERDGDGRKLSLLPGTSDWKARLHEHFSED